MTRPTISIRGILSLIVEERQEEGAAMTHISIPAGLDEIGQQIQVAEKDLCGTAQQALTEMQSAIHDSFPAILDETLSPILTHMIQDFDFFQERWRDIGNYLINVAHDAQNAENVFTSHWQ